MRNRKLALLLTLAMIISMFPINAFATEFFDMPKDWSTKALENAAANGLLKGDNGKIMPNENLTRAQMATIVNRAFGTTEKSSIDDFIDVQKDAWYYDEMSKAVQMKTFIGSGDKLYPDSNITREEAFVVLARAFKISGANENALENFSDTNDISDWARDGVSSLVEEGYIAGSNGRINPKQNITRAEFAQMMDNLLKNYISEEGTYTEDYSGNLMINVPNVTLKGLTVTGDLIIGDGVGDEEVTLDDVTVTGRVLVRGGGENSIKITGSSNIQNITIARVDGIVRVYAEDGTEIGEVIADGNDDAIIEGNFGTVTVVGTDITITATNAIIESAAIEGKNSNIIIGDTSTIKTVNVNAESAKVEVSGNVINIKTSIQAQNAEIKVTEGAKVESVTANGQGAIISGNGTVESVRANANDIAVTTSNTTVTAGEDTSGVTAGEDTVAPGETLDVIDDTTIPTGGVSGGGGSSSGNSSYKPVEALITALSAVPEETAPEVPDVLNTPKPDTEKLNVIYSYLEYLENAEAVAEAKEAFDALKPSSQVRVDANLTTKLNAAVAKIAELKSFVENNTTVTAWAATGGDAGKGRISVNVIWPFYTEDGFNQATGLTNLEEYLYNDFQNEIVRNKANLENLSPNKAGNWPTRITGSFDLGAARDSNSWNTGMYSLIGDEVTQNDLPNKVVVEFTYKGVLFVLEETVEITADMFVEESVEPVEALITALSAVPEETAPEVPDVLNTPKPDTEKLNVIYSYLEYLENAEAVAEAKEAFDALKPSSQVRVDANLTTKLNAAVAKIAELKSFIENNTTVTAWVATGGDAGKGRISVNVIWPFYTEDGFNQATGLTNLEEYLYNDFQNEIVRNKANLENLSPNKAGNWPTRITGSFDLGAARDSNSWNTGMYSLIGDEVTQNDLPNKVVVEFTYKGVLFFIEEEVDFTPYAFSSEAAEVSDTEGLKAALANETVKTIALADGTYDGFEVLNEQTLIAVGEKVFVNGTVTISSDNVIIEGLTIQAEGYGIQIKHGISSYTDITIRDNVINSTEHGIVRFGHQTVTDSDVLTNLTITGNDISGGNNIEGNQGIFLATGLAGTTTISNNNVKDKSAGLNAGANKEGFYAVGTVNIQNNTTLNGDIAIWVNISATVNADDEVLIGENSK